jgi:hypothetical protein
MPMRAGSLSDWNAANPPDSLAKAVEAQLEALMPLPAGEDPVPRRKLAVAIGRAVLGYLRAHGADITVAVPSGTPTTDKAVTFSVQDIP